MRLENEVFLRQKSFGEHDARDLIASNLEEVERLEKLATNLLALSRFEQDQGLTHMPVVIGEIVDEAVARIAHSKNAAETKFVQEVAAAKVDVNRGEHGGADCDPLG